MRRIEDEREKGTEGEREREEIIYTVVSMSVHFVFNLFKNEEDMLIPPGPNTRTKEDLLPSPDILELIDAHISEVSNQPRLYII